MNFNSQLKKLIFINRDLGGDEHSKIRGGGVSKRGIIQEQFFYFFLNYKKNYTLLRKTVKKIINKVVH